MSERITDQERECMEELSERGLSTQKIADRLGRSQYAVWSHLSAVGKTRSHRAAIRLHARRSAPPTNQLEKGAQLYERGASIREAARKAEVPRNRLEDHLGERTRSYREATLASRGRLSVNRDRVMRAGRMHLEFVSHSEIGERLGVSQVTATYYVQAYYSLMDMRYESPVALRRRIALEQQAAGVEPKMIALHLGVSLSTVYNYLNESEEVTS